MKWISGAGIRLENERSRALHAPLTELPASKQLIVPVCPEADADLWQIAPDGRRLSAFSAAAVCADRGCAVSLPAGGVAAGRAVLPLPGRGSWLCLYINTDAATSVPHTLTRPSRQQPNRESVLRTAEAAGIVDEVDGVPLADKLRRFGEAGIELLACDAVCDDPYNTDSLCALMENGGDITDGLALAARACSDLRAPETVIVTARAADAGFAAARRLRAQLGDRLLNVNGKYPLWPNLRQHAPFAGRMFGRVGAQACLRLNRAVRLHHPPERCIVTVSGTAVRHPRNFSVLLGTPIADVLAQCALHQQGYRLVAVRSALCGSAVADPARTPVTQDTRCILAMAELPPRETVCVACGRCAAACPVGVFPYAALHSAERGEWNKVDFYGAGRCIGCGACAAVCPANIPLVERLQHPPKPQALGLWKDRRD